MCKYCWNLCMVDFLLFSPHYSGRVLVLRWPSVCLSVCPSIHKYFYLWMINWVNINRFSANLVCALILCRSGLGLLMVRFRQFLTAACDTIMAGYYCVIFLQGRQLLLLLHTSWTQCPIWKGVYSKRREFKNLVPSEANFLLEQTPFQKNLTELSSLKIYMYSFPLTKGSFGTIKKQ